MCLLNKQREGEDEDFALPENGWYLRPLGSTPLQSRRVPPTTNLSPVLSPAGLMDFSCIAERELRSASQPYEFCETPQQLASPVTRALLGSPALGTHTLARVRPSLEPPRQAVMVRRFLVRWSVPFAKAERQPPKGRNML